MNITTDIQKLIRLIRKSTSLDDAGVNADPAYDFSDEDILDIIEQSIFEFNPEYELDTVPRKEYHFIVLLSKKEIYYRLATSSAPFYPLSAEGAELRKDYRFEHYMSLLRLVEREYTDKLEKYNRDKIDNITTGTLLSKRRHYDKIQMNIQQLPKVVIDLVDVTDGAIFIEWNKFNCNGGVFECYELYFSDKPIYDDFDYKFIDKVEPKIIKDINKVRAKFTALESDKTYYIVLVFKDKNGLTGVESVEVETLPKEEDSEPEETPEVEEIQTAKTINEDIPMLLSMAQEEVDEISVAFLDAWKDYFGSRFYYVPFVSIGDSVSIYGESKKKKYDYDGAIEFTATFKEYEGKDSVKAYGEDAVKAYSMTIVTKELLDKGINKIDTRALIVQEERIGNTVFVRKLNIIDDFKKVQFGDSKIFIKLTLQEKLKETKKLEIPRS